MHKITITVVDGASSAATGGTGTAGGSSGSTEKKKKPLTYSILNPGQTIKDGMKKGMSPVAAMGIMGGIGIAKQVGRQWLNFHLSDIGRRHGDSNYQAIIGRRMEIAGDVMSVGKGALAGAATGAMFGPKGALAGAAIGAASAGINMLFRQMDRQRAYQHQMFEENNSQAVGLARANFSATDGRLR